MDLFASLNMQTKSQQPMNNPYQKQSLGEFQSSLMKGPAFQPPQTFISGLSQPKKDLTHDPFAELDQSQSQQEQKQNESVISATLQNTSGSAFGFLGGSGHKPITQTKSETPRDNANMSISSINNASKHSFEELEKNDNIPDNVPNTSSNYYLQKPPETAEAEKQDNQFLFVAQS